MCPTPISPNNRVVLKIGGSLKVLNNVNFRLINKGSKLCNKDIMQNYSLQFSVNISWTAASMP